MWLILSRIWSSIIKCFKCCCPYKLSCYSTCCDAEIYLENEKKENNKHEEIDERIKIGSLEYSYHNKNIEELNDEKK